MNTSSLRSPFSAAELRIDCLDAEGFRLFLNNRKQRNLRLGDLPRSLHREGQEGSNAVSSLANESNSAD